MVPRSAEIKVSGRYLGGGEFLLTLKGLAARVFQHEVDHLEGILITDRAFPPRPPAA